MGYVIAAILVVLIVAAGVTFFVLSATRQRRRPRPAIAAPDERTPLGDTDQHADEPAPRRRARRDPAEARRPGEGGVGGEAEGEPAAVAGSERLSDSRLSANAPTCSGRTDRFALSVQRG